MAVVNADTGKVVATPPIGGDPDGDGFDPGTGLIFASCREGLVSVIHEDSAGQVQRRRQCHHAIRHAHDDARSQDASRVHGDGGFQGSAAPTPDNPRPRPQPIDGSFVILELGQ